MKKNIVIVFLILSLPIIALSGCGYNQYYLAPGNYGKTLSANQAEKLNKIIFAYLDIPIAKFAVVTPPTVPGKDDNNFYQPSPVIMHTTTTNSKTQKHGHGNKQLYNAVTADNKLFVQVFSKATVRINKTLNIEQAVVITIKKIRYDKGYEVISMSIKNLGDERTVTENFKYSNAGKMFKIKKFEVIQNLTVAEKYKRGMILWLKF